MMWRIAWFTVAAIALSYASFLFVGSILHAREAGLNEPVVVRDVLDRGAHYLSGMVSVPSPCDQLSVKTVELSKTTYMLDFNTWREPSVPCPDKETPRTFHTILFAPPVGVEFGATLDGVGLPIVVLPSMSPRSTTTEEL
jgi:hypothetical protein